MKIINKNKRMLSLLLGIILTLSSSYSMAIFDDDFYITKETKEINGSEYIFPFELAVEYYDDASVFLSLTLENINTRSIYIGVQNEKEEIIPDDSGFYRLSFGVDYGFSFQFYADGGTASYDGAFECTADDEAASVSYKYVALNYIGTESNADNTSRTWAASEDGLRELKDSSDSVEMYQIDGSVDNSIMASGTRYEEEPNDSWNSSRTKSTYSDYDNYGTIYPSRDVDWWLVSFNYEGDANFFLGDIPSGRDYDMYVYRMVGSTPQLIGSSTNGGNANELITKYVSPSYTYAVELVGWNGNYSMQEYLMLTPALDVTLYVTVAFDTRVSKASYAFAVNCAVTFPDAATVTDAGAEVNVSAAGIPAAGKYPGWLWTGVVGYS